MNAFDRKRSNSLQASKNAASSFDLNSGAGPIHLNVRSFESVLFINAISLVLLLGASTSSFSIEFSSLRKVFHLIKCFATRRFIFLRSKSPLIIKKDVFGV